MRLWSLHPRYLDRKGLVVLWREALLAKAVLKGKTKGYRHHPQLQRFRNRPVAFINFYLSKIKDEASNRGYRFDGRKIGRKLAKGRITLKRGQLAHEFVHLAGKLRTRDPARYLMLCKLKKPAPHPLFRLTKGGKESWERSR